MPPTPRSLTPDPTQSALLGVPPAEEPPSSGGGTTNANSPTGATVDLAALLKVLQAQQRTAPRSDKNVIAPRIGGIDLNEGVAWVGGSNLGPSKPPTRTSCYRPYRFRDQAILDERIRSGLPEARRFEDGGNISAMTFLRELKGELENLGLDTVFRILDSTGTKETYLLEHWGAVSLEAVRAWTTKLEEGGAPWPNDPTKGPTDVCAYDVENLKLSLQFLRNSVGPNTYARLQFVDSTGPEYLVMLLGYVAAWTNPHAAVRNLIEDLENLKLSNEPCEDVGAFAAKVLDICNQILGFGSKLVPIDLTFLAMKAFESPTDSRWNVFVNSKTNAAQDAQDPHDCIQEIHSIVACYNTRFAGLTSSV